MSNDATANAPLRLSSCLCCLRVVHICTSHVTRVSRVFHVSVVTCMNESSHIWISRDIYGWVVTYMDESLLSCVRCFRVVHICMSHVTRVSRVLHVYQPWHIWMSLDTSKWVVSFFSCLCWFEDSPHLNKSRLTSGSCLTCMRHNIYGWVVTYVNESRHFRHTSESSLKYMSRDMYGWVLTCMNQSCHFHLACVDSGYGVATMSRLLKIIGLFCKRAL